MKKAFLILALFVVSPLFAGEKELARYSYRGEYGQMSFSQQESDCVTTTFYLGWNVDQSIGRDKAEPSQYGWIQVHWYNQCSGEEKFKSGNFNISDLNLSKPKNLTSATLNGWTTVTWWSGDTEYTEEVYVDLSWNAGIERVRGTWVTTWEDGGFGTRFHNQGESRSGPVSGTVILDESTFFIENGWGTLGKNKSGTMVIYTTTPGKG